MRLMSLFLSTLVLTVLSTSVTGAAVADDVSCPDALGEIRSDAANILYLPARPLGANAEQISDVALDGPGKGRTIQSMVLDPVSCRWLATVHLKRAPDTIGLWETSDGGMDGPLRRVTSHEFAHPQNLSVQMSAHGVVWFWLPDAEGLGAKRFRLVENETGLTIADVEHFPLLDAPLPSNTTAVSADGRYLLILDLTDIGGKQVEAVRIYRMEDLIGTPKADLIDVAPIHVWPLAAVQQPKGQYRQGLAMIGGTVFVLSGPPKIGPGKWLFSYSIDGKLLASDPLDVGLREALSDPGTPSYEPEGLNIIRDGSGFRLTIGIASGAIGNRQFRLWSVPLVQQPASR